MHNESSWSTRTEGFQPLGGYRGSLPVHKLTYVCLPGMVGIVLSLRKDRIQFKAAPVIPNDDSRRRRRMS